MWVVPPKVKRQPHRSSRRLTLKRTALICFGLVVLSGCATAPAHWVSNDSMVPRIRVRLSTATE